MPENPSVDNPASSLEKPKISRRKLLIAAPLVGTHLVFNPNTSVHAQSTDNQPTPQTDPEPYVDKELEILRGEVMNLYNNPVGDRKKAVDLRFEIIQQNPDAEWFKLAESVHFFGADPRKKNLYAVPKEEAIDLISQYFPIYLTAQREYGVPWQLLALVHAAETGCSTNDYPDHYEGGYQYVGGMQRSTTFYTDKLVAELSKGNEYLGFFPQNYQVTPARDELTEKLLELNRNTDNYQAASDQEVLTGYEGTIYREEMQRFGVESISKTNDWQEILFAAWKLTQDARNFYINSQNSTKPITQEQALYQAMLAYSADRPANDRWNQFQGLKNAGKNRGLLLEINLNFSNPKLGLDPNDFKK